MRRAALGTASAVALSATAVLLFAGPAWAMRFPAAASPSPPPVQVSNCVVCHGNPAIAEDTGDPRLYVRRGLIAGSVHASLECTSCHATLSNVLHQDPVRELEVANASCGRCHEEQWQAWAAGAHGPTGGAPETRARPTCVTCHGAHGVPPAATGAFAAETATLCSNCHTERGESYFDRNYHGKETRLGRYDVAVCADCHLAHLVLPASDPRSSVNPANVLATCRKCHEGAPPNFADIQVHLAANPLPTDPKLEAVMLYMIVILVGTFGFFGAHMVLGIRHEWRLRRRGIAGPGGGG